MPVEEEKPPVTDRDPEFLADMRQLLEDSRALLSTEMAFHKARVRFSARAVKWMSIWFAIGLGFIVAATIVLSMGGLLVLAPLIGPLAAMLLLTLACILVAIAAILMARRKLSEMKKYFAIGDTVSAESDGEERA